ncbi:lactate dehydrogenase [Haloimpatiens sp. FM7330]|uniref:lactate/malate family dehydrogenase n=1 Tax=Haloimpatiens sp. FM7330 TaxID=3298610 RepID=UPI003638A5B8
MYFYTLDNKLMISKNKIISYNNIKNLNVKEICEKDICDFKGNIFALNKLDPRKSKRSFCVTNSNLLFIENESLNLLKNPKTSCENIPNWLTESIAKDRVTSLNTEYKSCLDILDSNFPILCADKPIKINVVGLGDVGGTLITGLRLLGEQYIKQIGIYDKDINKMKRWKFETNCILGPDADKMYPEIVICEEDNLFDCDMFVFCVSIGVPKVGNEKQDVRIAQLEGNAKVMKYYAKKARENNFKGIFAVVSDPVDLLCKCAFEYSNTDDNGNFDLNGLAPEQIRGYGLGVMHARANYYAKDLAKEYSKEGRAFGPHGEGLIIANSIKNYDENISDILTEKTKKANLDVRAIGFKPYIAPALSSGTLSLLATLKSEWNYSTNFLGGVFFGCKNKLTKAGLKLETLDIPEVLFNKMCLTYNMLK